MQETKLHASFHSCSCTTRQRGYTIQWRQILCVTAKERETPSPVLWSQASCASSTKNQIGIAQEQRICVSCRRVMEVKLDIAQAVCARDAEDGVVVPTNSHMSVFTTHDVDNLDGSAKKAIIPWMSFMDMLWVTNHLSHDNLGQKHVPIKLDPTDKSMLKLPDSCMIHPSAELN